MEEHQLLLGAAKCELIAQLFQDQSAEEVRGWVWGQREWRQSGEDWGGV